MVTTFAGFRDHLFLRVLYLLVFWDSSLPPPALPPVMLAAPGHHVGATPSRFGLKPILLACFRQAKV
jgi:hypothetical protein